ncbi:MAG: hypothetical protein AB7P04_05660 [Bacteriovoracia bacterium]
MSVLHPHSIPKFGKRFIRVRKEDSAFVYCLFESYEGIASYSTLEAPVGAHYRDLVLNVPPDFSVEVDQVLATIAHLYHEIPPPPPGTRFA